METAKLIAHESGKKGRTVADPASSDYYRRNCKITTEINPHSVS